MLYIFTFFVISMCFLFPKEKRITFFVLVCNWMLYALNSSNPDRLVYIEEYNNPSDLFDNEILFKTISGIFHNMGLDYIFFNSFNALVYFCLFYCSLKRLNVNINFALALHTVFILWLNITQIRNGIGMMIVLLGYTYLADNLNNKSINKALIYIGFVLIATLIHSSSILFAIFLIAYFFDNKKCLIISIAGFAFLFAISSPIFSSVMLLISKYMNSSKFRVWVSAPLKFGYIKYTATYGLVMILITLLLYYCSESKHELYHFSFNGLEKRKLILNFFFKTSILTLVFLPLMLRQLEWARLFRFDILLLIIAMSYYSSTKIKLYKMSKVIVFGGGLLSTFFFVMAFKTTSSGVPYFDVVFRKMFESNFLIEWFVSDFDKI